MTVTSLPVGESADVALDAAQEAARAARVAELIDGLTDVEIMANVLSEVLRLHERLDAFEALVGQLGEMVPKGLGGMLGAFLKG